jgi:5-methyltetrahydrofolate--homocysteine methyltransferase
MYLPQVIRSARLMKKAVAVLEPHMNADALISPNASPDTGGAKKIILATVKGDVHDIGKNIVGLVLACNGYQIVDLGVMVPAERILETAEKEQAAIIGLSGLISPSLDEMIHIAREMEKRRMKIPLLIGGAAASLVHTSLRITPEYSGPAVYVPDAGKSAEIVRALLSETERPRFLETLEKAYREAARRHEAIQSRIEILPLESARANKVPIVSCVPQELDSAAIIEFNDYPLENIIPHIDWQTFLQSWELNKNPANETSAAGHESRENARKKLLEDARTMLKQIKTEKLLYLKGVAGVFPAASKGDDVVLYKNAKSAKGAPPQPPEAIARFCFLRSQEKKRSGAFNPCLADFIAPASVAPAAEGGPGDRLGLFALSAGFGLEEHSRNLNEYQALLLASLANVLTEAFAETVHRRFREEWGFAGIRPAFGYPASPDHQDKRLAFALLEAEKRCGFALTESAMIIPAASVCGMFIANPGSSYFGIGAVGEDQLADWARRKGLSVEEGRRRAGNLR